MIDKIRERAEFAHFRRLHLCPAPVIRKWQEKSLRELIQHSSTHVPLWREIFSELGINESSIKNLEDLQKIPITNKDTYIGKTFEDYIDNHRNFEIVCKETTGTSGKPFRIIRASRYLNNTNYSDFSEFRFLLWQGKNFSDILKTKISRITGYSYNDEYRFIVHFLDFRANPEKIFFAIAKFNPEILVGYSSVFIDMAKMIETNKKLPKLAPLYIVSTGETLTPSARSYINEQFGSEIYDRYASEEVGVIGTECVMHDGFHINSETIVVEITDELGKALPEGKYGKIIITDLFNYNMPFIRYDIGDNGVLSSRPCSCGLETPRIWINGRYSACLILRGRTMHAFEFGYRFDEFMNQIIQYQVAKTGNDEITVRVMPGPAFQKATELKIKENLHAFLGDEVKIFVKIVKNIPRMPRGKCQIIVDETAAASNSAII